MKVAALDWLGRFVVVVLASASQIRAQTSVLPPTSSSTSVSQDLTELWRDGEQTTNSATDTRTSAATAITSVSTTQALSAGEGTTTSESPSITPTPLIPSTTQTPGHTFSSRPASSSSFPSTDPGVVSLTTASAPSTIQPRSQTHRDMPSQLNVGDEDIKGSGHRPNSLDPLLAGLLSVFIVTTAVVFVVLFLKFRQQNSNPEFHRLHDLPMDDLMEDTPLSRYTY